MTPYELRNRVIEDGIAEVKRVGYPPHKERGAIHGFELCRDLLTPEQYQRTLAERRRWEHAHICQIPIEEWWEYTIATLQVEFVWEVMKITWKVGDAWSARAMRVYTKHVQPEDYRTVFGTSE